MVGVQERLKLFRNKMKKNNSQRGISLVETIVYVAIFSIFVTGLAQFATTLSSTRLHMQGVLEVNDQGSQAIKLITQTLRNGSSVTSPSIGDSTNSLNLVTDTTMTSPTTFSLNSGVLYITEGTGSPVAMTNNKVVVSDLVFLNLSRPDTPDIVKISFTIPSISTRDPYSVTFDASGALRK